MLRLTGHIGCSKSKYRFLFANKKRAENGFTLTELIVVIAIMGILLAIVSLNFSPMQNKANIENQAKELKTDLSDLRLSAIQNKSDYMAILNANSPQITFRSYTTNEQITPTTGKVQFSKNLKYKISNTPTGTAPCANIQVDQRGYIWSAQTAPIYIYIQPTGSEAYYDCLIVTAGNINLGKYNGTTCAYQ